MLTARNLGLFGSKGAIISSIPGVLEEQVDTAAQSESLHALYMLTFETMPDCACAKVQKCGEFA